MASPRPPSAPHGRTTDLLNKQLKLELEGLLCDAGEAPLCWPALLWFFLCRLFWGCVWVAKLE